jgi:2-iminoacetate synthase ThiH
MSALVDRAIRESSLDDVLAARRHGTLTPGQVEKLRSSDLLVLGALADRIRAEEVGDEVRIYTDETPEAAAGVVVLPRPGSELTGLELLREVAMARTAGPRGGCVRVDWTRCGLELAQIAMGFGANELAGRLASKRGLPLAEGEKLGVGKKSRLEAADVVKRKELEGFVRRAGRTPSFVTLAQEAP